MKWIEALANPARVGRYLFPMLLLFLIISGCAPLAVQNPPHESASTSYNPTNSVPDGPSCQAGLCMRPHLSPLVDTWNNIHLFQSFSYNINDPAAIARSVDFVWGAEPSKVSAFRQANPQISLSYYMPLHRDG